MKKEETLTLMYKDLEVLKVKASYKRGRVFFVKQLEHFDKAPYGVKKEAEEKNYDKVNFNLTKFFNARVIPQQRHGYEEILKATGCSSALELSLKGHGLCLSNHYWVKRRGEHLKYDEINFFTNKWDDSFARALMNDDFEALKNCDYNVPDIATAGWGVKGWLCEEDGPKLYKLGIDFEHPEEAIGEALASRLGQRLFGDNVVLKYELRQFNGKYASVSSPIINIDEEMVPLANILDWNLYSLYKNKTSNKNDGDLFYEKIKEYKIPGLSGLFEKVACLRDLTFLSDLHFNNLSFIRNIETGEFKPAPIYDLGGAFGSSKTGRRIIENPTDSTFIMIYFLFNDMDPNWDYSWYNPDKLVGFEKEIEEYLSKSDFYTPRLIEWAIEIYHRQKASLDEIAKVKN